MSDNLALWQSVEKTPESHTKKITGKSYQGTSPRPHHLIHKATEKFGPCGIGWGFTVVDERIEEGAPGEKMHIARVKVWYEWEGKRGEVEHIGGTQFSGTRSSGKAFTDEDAPKKSVTDALVKALSMIGFAGDIFMGRYDDSKYVADLKNEERQSEPRTTDQRSEVGRQEVARQNGRVSAAQMKRGLEEIQKDLLDCNSIADVNKCAKIWAGLMDRDGWTKDYRDIAAPKFAARRQEIKNAEAEDVFPGDTPSITGNSYADNYMAG